MLYCLFYRILIWLHRDLSKDTCDDDKKEKKLYFKNWSGLFHKYRCSQNILKHSLGLKNLFKINIAFIFFPWRIFAHKGKSLHEWENKSFQVLIFYYQCFVLKCVCVPTSQKSVSYTVQTDFTSVSFCPVLFLTHSIMSWNWARHQLGLHYWTENDDVRGW